MTKDEIIEIFDLCRQQATRIGVVLGSFGTVCGVVALVIVIIYSRGGFSREIFLSIASIILFVNFAVFYWGMRRLRQIPIICKALCSKCGTSLVAQRDQVLTKGVCGECNNIIFKLPNKIINRPEDASNKI